MISSVYGKATFSERNKHISVTAFQILRPISAEHATNFQKQAKYNNIVRHLYCKNLSHPLPCTFQSKLSAENGKALVRISMFSMLYLSTV